MTEAPSSIAAPPVAPQSPPPSRLLAGRVEALRRRHVAVAVLTGVATLVVVGVELLALAMFADWWLELPRGIRAVSLAVQGAVLGVILWRFVLTPWLRQPDEDELALMVEKARPEFRSRLIASLQLVRPGALTSGASVALVTALVEEAEGLARPLDFRRIVPTDRLKKFGWMAVFVTLVGLAGFLYGREICGVLLKRVFLSSLPVPRKTRLIVPEGDRIVGLGDTVRLEAFVEGIIPARGKVEVKYRSRRAQEFPLEQDPAQRVRFARTLDNVQDSFTYRFHLGDGQSESFSVKAIPRPTVATIECEQDFPAYTGLKTTRRSLGDLSLLAGSALRIQATATKDLQSATLKLTGSEQKEFAMRVNPEQPREMRGRFNVPARGLNGFQIQMLDTEQMESRDSAVYRVDVLPDKPPQVRITYPDRKEELLTRIATMLVAFEAADDFRIARLRLKYKVDTVDSGAEKAIELDLGGEAPQRVRRRYEWKMPDTLPGVSEGSVIEYWIEAEDNNDITGPGIGATDHQLARIVSESEKRADLLNRAGDYLGSINDVAGDQEKLNRTLGETIREKAALR
jgi:hypothetical protein